MRLFETYAEDIFPGAKGRELIELVAHTTAIDITPAAAWFYESEQGWFDYDRDFPSLLPPWPISWFEFEVPKFSNVNGNRADLRPDIIPRLGCMAVANEHEPEDRVPLMETDGLFRQVGRMMGGGIPADPQIMQRRQNALRVAVLDGVRCRWTAIFRVFGEHRREIFPSVIGAFYLDEQGHMIPGTQFLLHEPDMPEDVAANENNMLTPFLFGISLLHCKNITTQDIDVPAKVRKARAKRGVPEVRYRTVVVQPMRQQVRRENGGKSDVHTALHFVRGHFASYTPEKPLFGKYSGTFWRELHARGSADLGKLKQSYRVNRPAEAS